MAVDIGGNVTEYIVLAHNCSVGRMLLTDVELVSGLTCVKRFQRSNGVDTVLYKTYIFMLRLYDAIRSILLDRLRYTSYTIVHWINQPIICVTRVQTCIITSTCRCPQVSIISDLSCTETVDAKQMVSN